MKTNKRLTREERAANRVLRTWLGVQGTPTDEFYALARRVVLAARRARRRAWL